MRTLAAVALVFLIAACQAPSTGMTEAELAQARAAAEELGNQWLEGFKNMDLEAHGALLDRPTMFGFDGTTYYANYDEWMAHVSDLFSGLEVLEGSWANTRVEVLAPDAVLFFGQNDMRVRRTDGPLTRVDGVITLLMRELDGTWKITHQASTGRWTPLEEG